jgi:hypothetical protein
MKILSNKSRGKMKKLKEPDYVSIMNNLIKRNKRKIKKLQREVQLFTKSKKDYILAEKGKKVNAKKK